MEWFSKINWRLFVSCLGFALPGYSASPLFQVLDSDETGIQFNNTLPIDGDLNILLFDYYYNGGGVAIGDLNGDGLPDIYLTANLEPNRLYLNEGNLHFRDITDSADVAGTGKWATGVTMADVNADGLLDIYVCYSGPFEAEERRNEIFINNGDLTFSERAADFGLDVADYSTQALFFDLDRDNDLDLFLLNHSVQSYDNQDIPMLRNAEGIHSGDKLFLNRNGTYHDITSLSGIRSSPLGYGLGVAAGDLNGDGWTDLYVANDYAEPDYLYINDQLGGFTEIGKTALKHMSNFGMGVDIADFNNDGLADIMVGDMAPADNYRQKTNMASMNPGLFQFHLDNRLHYQYMFNTLQLNRGDLRFSEVAQLAGVSNTDWSWAALFGDVDNDGCKDLLITNGFRREHSNKDYGYVMEKKTKATQDADIQVKKQVMIELIENMSEGKLSNYIFRNQGDLTFVDRSEEWGLGMETFSNGAAMADLDNDGDLDLVINNIDQPAMIFRNTLVDEGGPAALAISFQGPKGNPLGIGAKITVKSDGLVQVQENFPTRGYLSSVPAVLMFGTGGMVVDSVEVQWPDGNYQKVELDKPIRRLTLHYEEASFAKPSLSSGNAGLLFEDATVSSGVNFKHIENRHNDFEDEVLLPHKLSRLGPALAVGDVNGDGLEDFFVGGAARQSGKLFLQQSAGGFRPASTYPWRVDAESEDIGAVFFDCDGDSDLDLYVASGGNEFSAGDPLLADRLYLNDGSGRFAKAEDRLPGILASGAVVEPFDFDDDGDLDLFVGGRLVSKRYPTPADSFLLVNEDGRFVDKTGQLAPGLRLLGLVTSALWTDVDGDGKTDLMVAGEWMPITVFKNQGQAFNRYHSNELNDNIGWWYSLAEVDFDGDGDQDYLAGNLGLNYKYKATLHEPFSVYANDFDNSGSLDIVLSYYNDGTEYPLRGRQCSSQQMPVIADQFKTYDAFGRASLTDIYQDMGLNRALTYHATNFAHCMIENLGGGKFDFRPLPGLVQISTVNGILIEDYNGDNHPDLVLAGNLYPVEVETIRADASYGLFLTGDGEGNFTPQEIKQSGLILDGDVKALRSIRLADGGMGVLAAVNDDVLRLIRAIPTAIKNPK